MWAFFRALGHSRICEEANKLLRDTEKRESPNETACLPRMLSTLANSALLKEEQRPEVKAMA